MGRSLSADIDDLTAGFVRVEDPLRGEKAEPVAVIAARAKIVNFMAVIFTCVALFVNYEKMMMM